jgi:hypothetical protein
VSRVLPYCAYLERDGLTLPHSGVEKSPVAVVQSGSVRLLWSEIPWPFQPEHLQQNAVEFHDVVHHVFRQTAVIPFRLLSTFEDAGLLKRFVAEHQVAMAADLDRLASYVQMESVIYTIAERPGPAASGTEYLRARAQQAGTIREHAERLSAAVADVGAEVRLRENKNGIRLFALVNRGAEHGFHDAITGVAVPNGVSRRISGPWPAAEFMSEEVKMPALVTRNE